MKIHLSYAYGCPDVMLLRELCSYDILCPECSEFIPEEKASLNYKISDVGLTSLHWSRQYEYPWALQHSNLTKDHVCLDAGGGYAVFKYALAKRCKKVVSIDTNQDYLDKTIKSSKRLGFDNIEFHNCAIQDYKSEQKFDKIYCMSVLEHIRDKQTRFDCINNMIRMLKPDGEFYLTFDVVIKSGTSNYDFYMNMDDGSELLKYFGIESFQSDKYYTASFPDGCILAAICLKIWDFQ